MLLRDVLTRCPVARFAFPIDIKMSRTHARGFLHSFIHRALKSGLLQDTRQLRRAGDRP